MNVIGYSERGVINTLFHELANDPNASALLHRLLSQAFFPFTESRPILGETKVLIEQSFSDFGDADALFLMQSTEGRTCSVFVEAKVKTFQGNWRIEKEFQNFQAGLNQQDASRKKKFSSNLFTQLYYKQCLVSGLRKGGIQLLKQGLALSPTVATKPRKIGNNGVVLKATQEIAAHLDEVFFLAIVPAMPDPDAPFVRELQTAPHPTLEETWDVTNYCFLTWPHVREFCKTANLLRTIAVFDHNEGQIS